MPGSQDFFDSINAAIDSAPQRNPPPIPPLPGNPHSSGRRTLGLIVDAIAGLGGRQPGFYLGTQQNIERQRQDQAEQFIREYAADPGNPEAFQRAMAVAPERAQQIRDQSGGRVMAAGGQLYRVPFEGDAQAITPAPQTQLPAALQIWQSIDQDQSLTPEQKADKFRLITGNEPKDVAARWGEVVDPATGQTVLTNLNEPQAQQAFGMGGGGGDPFHDTTVQFESGGRQFDENGQPLRNPNSSAVGRTQMTRAAVIDAAQALGEEPDFAGVANDPATNDRYSQAYQGVIRQRFNGNVPLMHSAYIAGPSATEKAVRERGNDWMNDPAIKPHVADIRRRTADTMRRAQGGGRPPAFRAPQKETGTAPSAAEKQEDSRKQAAASVLRKADQMERLVNLAGDQGVLEDEENPNIITGALQQALGTGTTRERLFGRFVYGAKGDGTRKRIEALRGQVAAEFRTVFDLSARQMDSDAELRLFLGSFYDPTATKQANLATLESFRGSLEGALDSAQSRTVKGIDGKTYLIDSENPSLLIDPDGERIEASAVRLRM